MADFTSGIGPMEMPREWPMVNPVNTGTANSIQSLTSIGGAIGSTLMQGSNDANQLKAGQQQTHVLNNYVQNMMRTQDLDQQGAFGNDPGVAMRKMRLLTAQALADHPGMTQQIFELSGKLVGNPLSGGLTTKSYEQQQEDAQAQKQAATLSAQQAGFISPGMTPQQQTAGVQNHQQFLLGQTQLNQAQEVLKYQTGQVGLTNANLDTAVKQQSLVTGQLTQAKLGTDIQMGRLQLANAAAQQHALAGLGNQMGATYNMLDDKSNTIVGQIGQQVPDPTNPGKQTTFTKQMAIDQLQRMYGGTQYNMSLYADQYKIPGVEGLQAPLKAMLQAKIDQLTGKTTTDVANQTVQEQTALKQQMLANTSPDFLTLAAASKMLPASVQSLLVPIGNQAVSMLKQNNVLDTNGNPVNNKPANVTNGSGTSDQDLNTYFQMLKNAAIKANAGTLGSQANQELSGHMAQVMKGVVSYASTTTNPTELNSVMQALADPVNGKYIANKDNGVLSQVDPAQVNGALELYYKSQVAPLIRDEFRNSEIPIGMRPIDNTANVSMSNYGGNYIQATEADQRPASSEIHMVFNGSGVSFVPVANGNLQAVQDKVKQLNQEVAPVINTMVRADAHINGTQDYKKAFIALNNNYFGLGNSDADNKAVMSQQQAQDVQNANTD